MPECLLIEIEFRKKKPRKNKFTDRRGRRSLGNLTWLSTARDILSQRWVWWHQNSTDLCNKTIRSFQPGGFDEKDSKRHRWSRGDQWCIHQKSTKFWAHQHLGLHEPGTWEDHDKRSKVGHRAPLSQCDELVWSIVSFYGAFPQKSSDILPRPLTLLDKTR